MLHRAEAMATAELNMLRKCVKI